MSRILIVDDSAFSVEFQKSVLESMGADISIDTASMLDEAKRLVLSNRYDLAVLDISLPDGEATELIPLLREVNQETKIVALTVYGSRYVKAAKMFDLFLTKPIDKKRYLQEVGRLLRSI